MAILGCNSLESVGLNHARYFVMGIRSGIDRCVTHA